MKLKQHLLIVLMIILGGLGTYAQVAVPFTQRLAGGSVKIKGDIVFVGNNITNRAPAATPSDANTPYNGTANNNGLNFEYIDVDGDASTFSSSTADLNIAVSCKRIVYAGLYWTATYPFERSGPGGDGTSSNYTGSPRNNTWNQVKFKVPGGAYVDLTADNAADPAGDEDSIIFDGFNAANPSASFYAAPYVCYKNVTNLVQALANANGQYAVANQRAARGIRPDGISSGWSLVIIYESPTLPSKYISVFDGYANIYDGINAANAVDFTVNGFQTLPAPLPVRARIGVSTLEGDVSLTNDRFRIRANSVGGFTTLSNAVNPADNFFNGSISNNGAIITTRNPNSSNTLGYDLDIVNVNNPTNSVIPNGETGATLRVTTNGDAYGTYLATFDVEIIEPVISLTKVVQDIAGNDIGNAEVQLCQDLVYVIGFQNIGNDDAQNFTIRDVLPVNVTLDLAATQAGLPAGVTVQSYAGGVITFAINNSLVQIGDPRVEIRLRVRVVCSCLEMDDACSNLIQNQAFATYQGILNTAQITDDPSLSSFVACNLGDPSPSNFLVNLDDCDFTRTEVLCGPSIVLTAANGYQTYTWSGPGTITPVPGTNNQSVTVTQVGTYTVNDIINTSPCKSIVETINVISFGASLTNPVIPYADQVVTCPNNGTQLPLIFLCGAGDSQLIQTNITGATGIDWYQLSGTCLPLPAVNCPNENASCTWNLLSSGPNFNATAAGQYRVIVRFPGGCDRTFYFNVYENILNPTYVSRDIICSTPGQITVNNVPAGYEYSLTGAPGSFQPGNTFTISTPGTYTVYIQQIGVTGGCVFTIPNIGIRARNFTATFTLTQPLCTGDKGSINIVANDGEPQYTYTISGATSTSAGPMVANNYVFNNLNPGNHTYQVTTQDGCVATGNFTINTPPVLTLTAALTRPLTCTPGEITVYPVGGTAPYNYVITGAVSTTQSSPVIAAPVAGTYNIEVIDFNNCRATTSIVVNQVQPPVFTITDTDILCASSGNSGTITINVSNANGSTLMYSINGVAGPFLSGNVFTNLAPGTYNVVVQYTYGSAAPCTTTPQAVVITAPPALTGTATLTTTYTCSHPGVITVTASGGTPGYTYSNGGPFQAANTFTVTASGTYTITIRDNNGCTITRTVVVPVLNGPSDLYLKDQIRVTCPSLTGMLNVDVVPGFGGCPQRRYRIVSPIVTAYNTSGLFAGLPPGAYTFEIIDCNDCTYQETFVLDPIVPTVITPQVTNNVRCFGTATGSGQFVISNIPNGTDYNYTVTNSGGTTITSASGTTPASGSTNITVNLPNLPASTYTISVYNDYNECTNTASFTITQPASALTATLSSTPITCSTNGSVTVNASGGWGGYIYSISPNVGITQSGSTFSNITAGTYTVTTTDSGGCVVTNTITFTNAPALSATISATSDFCYDTTNGATIVVTPSGGTPPFTYTINNSPNTPNTSNTFGPLTPGTYNIVVTDSFGCTFALPAQTINPQLTLGTNLTKDLDCTASPNAIITGTVAGGYAPYTYTVNGSPSVAIAGTTFTYSTATAGTYNFVVTDTRGCVTAISSVTIEPLSLPQITSVTQTQQILCNGDSTAAINVVIDTTVGTAPYVINVFNNTTSTDYGTQTTGLPAGNYTITLTDGKSCTDTETITITQPAPINFTAVVNPITCSVSGTALGSICVNGLTGGTAPYVINLYDLTGGTGTQTFATPVPVNHCFTNINFGIYNLEVVDANGCTLVRTNLIMSSPPNDLDIAVSTSIPSCAAGGTAVVSVPGGFGGPYEFAIMVHPDPANPLNIYLPADAGFPLQHTFTGLTPGAMYTFIVHDLTTGCYYFEQSATTIPTNSTMVVNPLVATNVTCIGAADGTVTFTVTGTGAGAASVNYTIYNAQTNIPITPLPGPTGTIPAPFPSTTYGPLAPGNYYIQLVENGGVNGGCGIISSTFTISQSSTPLAITATATNDDCNVNGGVITAVATGGTAPYRYSFVLSPLGPGPFGAPGANTANVESGTYNVYVQDANGCIRSTTVTVNLDPTPVIAATAGSPCVPQGTYQITVSLTTPGVGPYTLSLDGGAFVTHTLPHVFGGLSSGTHTVQVRDFNGCGNTVSVTILNPLIGSAAFTTQPVCNNPNGQITVTTTGGSGNYSYSITPNPGVILLGNVFNNVPPGSYVITINDTTTGCTTTASANIPIPDPVTFTTTTTPVVCNGDSNGTITVNLSAGNNNPVYTYEIVPGTGPQTSNVFTGLTAGTYSVIVTSGRGCSLTQNNITVGTPSPVVASVSATPFTCAADNSVNTSTVTITGAGGVTPYTYSIDGTNYFTTNTFAVVDNGAVQNITVYVRDANGCIDSDVVVINPLPALVSATITQNTAITCTNPEQITVTVVGGSGNFNYELIPSSGTATPQPQASNVFTITTPGTYSIRVNDLTTGCYIMTIPYVIAPYDTIQVDATATNAVTCFGGNDGSISINVTGYTGAYTYNVLNSTNTVVLAGAGNTSTNPMTIGGLGAGNYTVQITETNSPFCTEVSGIVSVQGPTAALVLSAVISAPLTCDPNTAQITATATDGWGTYEYELVGPVNAAFSSNNVFSNLPAGNYTVNVRDLEGCLASVPVTITTPTPISTTVTPSTTLLACFGDTNASITIAYPTGGQGSNYSYIFNTISPVTSPDGPHVLPLGGTTITGLGAGTYSVTIIDGFNCTFTSSNIVINQPTQVSASLALTNTQSCDNPTVLTLTATGGTAPYTYSADGVTYSAATFNPSVTISIPALTTGVFHYFVRDANGCVSVVSNDIQVDPIPAMTLSTLTQGNILCGGMATGTITAIAQGGLGNYTYSLVDAGGNPIAVGTQATPGVFTNLPQGTYYVHVVSTNAFGSCLYTSGPVTITEPPVFVVSYSQQNVKCNGGSDGTITVTTSGGTGIVKYAISPNLNQFIDLPANGVVGNLAAGNYTIIVQDQNGCFNQYNFTIGEPPILGANIANIVPEVCAEDNAGSFDVVNIVGGTGPYTVTYNVIYSGTTTVVNGPVINLASGVTSWSFTGLNGGEYEVIVTDFNGCTYSTQVIIDPGVLFDPQALVTFPCVSNGPAVEVEVLNMSNSPSNAFSPLADYLFSLDDPTMATAQNSNIFTSANYPSLLVPGTHVIYVTNANGCPHQTLPFTITAADVDPLMWQGPGLVQGGLNEIVANVQGGTQPYTYTFNGYNNGNDNSYVYDQTGPYTVVVTDSAGCFITMTKPFTFIPIYIPDVFTPDGDGNNDEWKPQNTSIYPNLKTKVYDRYGRVVAELNEGQGWNGKYHGNELPTGDYWYVLKVDGNDGQEFVGHFTLYR